MWKQVLDMTAYACLVISIVQLIAPRLSSKFLLITSLKLKQFVAFWKATSSTK